MKIENWRLPCRGAYPRARPAYQLRIEKGELRICGLPAGGLKSAAPTCQNAPTSLETGHSLSIDHRPLASPWADLLPRLPFQSTDYSGLPLTPGLSSAILILEDGSTSLASAGLECKGVASSSFVCVTMTNFLTSQTLLFDTFEMKRLDDPSDRVPHREQPRRDPECRTWQ